MGPSKIAAKEFEAKQAKEKKHLMFLEASIGYSREQRALGNLYQLAWGKYIEELTREKEEQELNDVRMRIKTSPQ